MTGVFIPNYIRCFLRELEHEGFQAYLVGGCVRDRLLNKAPNDWDVCTDALPEELKALFPDALTYGMRHGTVTVKWQNQLIEVTTFRTEGSYSDHRRPDSVTFIHDLQGDLARRDFTINAIALDADGNLHDPFDGLSDLQEGIIRAVGAAEERFREDALRMLRAVRFSAQLGFTIEAKTHEAIMQCASLAASLSAERVSQEIEKTLLSSSPDQISVMIASGLLSRWIPDSSLLSPEKLKQVFPERIRRWCAFCLMLQNTEPLNHLRLDRKTTAICSACLQFHNEKKRDALFWKQAINRYGEAAVLTAADVLSAWDSNDDILLLRAVLCSGECCTKSELAIHGDDLTALGLSGKEIGAALDAALNLVWRFPERNQRDMLLKYLRKEFTHG